MSGTLPINDFATVTIKNNTPTATSVSLSGRRQSKQLAAQYWTLECEYTPLDRSEAAQVMAFLNKQNNSLESFDVVIPQYSRPAGTVAALGGTPVLSVAANAAIGATAISVDFDTITSSSVSDATKTFRAGDFIKFTNHNKTYQISDDVTINGSGAGTINIFPGLYTAITTSHDVTYWNVPFTVFNTETTQEYQFTIGDQASITLKLHEAL
jgi:hypothetical protein